MCIKCRREGELKRDKEKSAARKKVYNFANAEIVKMRYRKWYEANKKRKQKYHYEWVKKNPERARLIDRKKWHKRRALKRSLNSTLTVTEWKACKEYFDFRCAYCGRRRILTQEHYIPLSLGGDYSMGNIIPACRNCNSQKHDLVYDKWYPKQAFYSAERACRVAMYLFGKGSAA